jgi:ribosomal protein S18 acetylase RimI-like enzyme
MRFLERADVPSMLALQEIVEQNLPQIEIYRIDPPEYIYNHFSGNQNVIGALVDGELVAYHVVSFPGINKDNFGWDIGLTNEQMLKVAHFETTAVHPEHRSRHLARKMADIHFELLQNSGYEHVLCTVSPINYPSLCNVFRRGFLIKGLSEKYYGLRYVMYKGLKLTSAKEPKHVIWLSYDELEQQRILLENGYFGFAVQCEDNRIKVAYGEFSE